MKLVKLEAEFFCGLAWAQRQIVVLAANKEAALDVLKTEALYIKLERSLKSGATLSNSDYEAANVTAPQHGMTGDDHGLFITDPERFIRIYFEDAQLPFFITRT